MLPPLRTAVVASLLILLALLGAGCGEERTAAPAERGADRSSPIVFGVSGPFEINRDHLLDGVALAVEEINDAGGIDGRTLRVVTRDDQGSAEVGKKIAREFAANPDLVAVIGHINSSVSIPTSVIYEHEGVLMITPGSTAPAFTQQGYDLIFRMIPSDSEIGAEVARFANRKGYRRVIIYHQGDEYGRGLANTFEREAARLGLEIVDRRAWTDESNAESFRRDIAQWRGREFDAIFVAGLIPGAPEFIRVARAGGIGVPMLAGNALDAEEFVNLAGEAANGTIVASVFHPDAPRPEVSEFNHAFEQRFGVLPDSWAAQGYDAVYLLAHAIERAGSARPVDMARALKEMPPWEGVTGAHAFRENGEITGKPVVKKIVRDGEFEFLEE